MGYGTYKPGLLVEPLFRDFRPVNSITVTTKYCLISNQILKRDKSREQNFVSNTWAAETSNGSLNTTHFTHSNKGGVVSDPS